MCFLTKFYLNIYRAGYECSYLFILLLVLFFCLLLLINLCLVGIRCGLQFPQWFTFDIAQQCIVTWKNKFLIFGFDFTDVLHLA